MKNFIEKLKKSVLLERTTTILFMAALIALFIGLTLWINSLNLDPIDLTTGKLYTLTEISKEKVKDVDQEVDIYFVGYLDDSPILDLAKQYHNVNEKINVETVIANERQDLVQKYGIDENTVVVIVESEGKSKILQESDFYTYNPETYEQIDLTEERLTNAVLFVNSDKVPVVLFLEGYSSFSINQNMNFLAAYLKNEVTEYFTLNLINEGTVPETCDTLVITTPEIDFDDIATNAIIDYINRGGNILWFNSVVATNQDFPNVNRVLATYGVKPFEVGYINETDVSKMMKDAPYVILPTINSSDITKNVGSVLMLNATKLNFVTDEELENLNVTKTNLLQTSQGAFFRTNFTAVNQGRQEGEAEGSFIVGALLDKKIDEEKNSKLVIYGENIFITDYTLSQSSSQPMLGYAYNKDLAIDSILYLINRQEDIVIRKDVDTTNYTATVEQNNVIQLIIFGVPVVIIVLGIVVWQVRRRKK